MVYFIVLRVFYMQLYFLYYQFVCARMHFVYACSGLSIRGF
jgi:hypothetical protein